VLIQLSSNSFRQDILGLNGVSFFDLVLRLLDLFFLMIEIIDLESTPRYPSWSWVQRLGEVNKEHGSIMRLAGHLCQSRCQEVR
jgi:hypothetical protein